MIGHVTGCSGHTGCVRTGWERPTYFKHSWVMLWMTKCDCNSSKFHTGGCDICPYAHLLEKQSFSRSWTTTTKSHFDININVTLGVLVFLFLAKSLGVYKYTTPSKGTGTCYLRWMWAWIWSPHSPDSCFFTRYLGATLDSSVLFLFPRARKKRESFGCLLWSCARIKCYVTVPAKEQENIFRTVKGWSHLVWFWPDLNAKCA